MSNTASKPDASSATAQRNAQIKRESNARFEKWALTYDRSWLNEFVFFPSIRACQEEVHRWLPARNHAPFRMLDVGCGTGSLLAIMETCPQAELLVGLDFSDQMIRRAAEKFASADRAGCLHAVRADSERLPFADASFDVLTCCNSFHHYPHQQQALREFRRVLRPGGLLVLIDGFRDNVVGWVIYDVAVVFVEQDVHHAPWAEMRQMIEGAGFACLHQRKMNVLAPLLVNVAHVGQ